VAAGVRGDGRRFRDCYVRQLNLRRITVVSAGRPNPDLASCWWRGPPECARTASMTLTGFAHELVQPMVVEGVTIKLALAAYAILAPKGD
jgi:hypothetical protein